MTRMVYWNYSSIPRVMAESTAGQKLKVFISYSRRDSSDFADELVAGLELAGFAPFLDRHDIVAGEDWEARLGDLIQEADTVVFVVSPEAVRSERCEWEVAKTVALSKRLLPVIFKPVPDAEIPEQLRRLQFVRFDTGPRLTRPLTQLAEVLRRDVDWIREHTRLGELAGRWQARSRPESLLLRGDDLDAAKAWVGKRKAEAPEVTDLQRTSSGKAMTWPDARRWCTRASPQVRFMTNSSTAPCATPCRHTRRAAASHGSRRSPPSSRGSWRAGRCPRTFAACSKDI
jgi:hypothetical protein